MSSLLAIREGLREYASGLRLESEDLPQVFETSLVETSAELAGHIAAEFSMPLAKRAVALRLASKLLLEEPSPDSMARTLEEFGALVVGLRHEMRQRPAAAEWAFARQFAGVAESLTLPRPGENPSFADLPRMLEESEWVQACLRRNASVAGLDFEETPAARGFHRGHAKRWLRKTSLRTDGRLCTVLENLMQAVENRARQVWFLRRCGEGEVSVPRMYTFAHTELFPDLHCTMSEPGLALEVAKLKGLALGLQLQDFALCFDSPDWLAQYALNYLLPPAPGEWSVRSASHLGRLLRGRVSHWYFYPFNHDIAPLEVTGTVLRLGRPPFYERVAAHAVLEYSLLQGVSFSRQAAASWLEVQAGLEREFQTLFDAYLLRVLHYPRLGSPEGWCRYLGALDALHDGGAPDAEFLEFRHGYLARRGLQSSIEILYRTTESHSAVN